MYVTNPTAFLRKLKMALTILSKISDNVSKIFPANLLRKFASLFNQFFQGPIIFQQPNPEAAGSSPYPRTPLIASTIIGREGNKKSKSIEAIVIFCSLNKVRLLSAKDEFLSRTFSMDSLILAIYVCNTFLFCNSHSRHGCGSVFKSSNLFIYSCLCSSE